MKREVISRNLNDLEKPNQVTKTKQNDKWY